MLFNGVGDFTTEMANGVVLQLFRLQRVIRKIFAACAMGVEPPPSPSAHATACEPAVIVNCVKQCWMNGIVRAGGVYKNIHYRMSDRDP